MLPGDKSGMAGDIKLAHVSRPRWLGVRLSDVSPAADGRFDGASWPFVVTFDWNISVRDSVMAPPVGVTDPFPLVMDDIRGRGEGERSLLGRQHLHLPVVLQVHGLRRLRTACQIPGE